MVANFDEKLKKFLSNPCLNTWNPLKGSLFEHTSSTYDAIVGAIVSQYKKDDPTLGRCVRELNAILEILTKSTDPGEFRLCERIRTLRDKISIWCGYETKERDTIIPTETKRCCPKPFDCTLLCILICIFVVLLVLVLIFAFTQDKQ